MFSSFYPRGNNFWALQIILESPRGINFMPAGFWKVLVCLFIKSEDDRQFDGMFNSTFYFCCVIYTDPILMKMV
jgi:hypothetical protein